MFFHDAVADAESESGAFAYALGGVERIEDAFGVFDACAIVGELRTNVASKAGDPNLEFAAAPRFQNGVDRVIDDIQKHLFDLMRVGDDQRLFRWKIAFHTNVVDLEIVVPQCERFVKDLANIDFIAFRLALARER